MTTGIPQSSIFFLLVQSRMAKENTVFRDSIRCLATFLDSQGVFMLKLIVYTVCINVYAHTVLLLMTYIEYIAASCQPVLLASCGTCYPPAMALSARCRNRIKSPEISATGCEIQWSKFAVFRKSIRRVRGISAPYKRGITSYM